MSDRESPNGLQPDLMPEGGILAALPRARPQRASPRRAAARDKTSKSETVASAGKSAATGARGAKATGARSADGTGARADQVKKAGPRAPAKRARASRATTDTDADTRACAKQANTKHTPSAPTEPPAPRQGYEPEEEVELGTTVNPPSGAELVESVVEIVGEIANSGIAAGGRLLKDAFSLLHRP